MKFLGSFRKDPDAELQRLADMANANKTAFEPHLELALAYMAKVQTPPAWDEKYAKKSIEAFHKAIKIATKNEPDKVDSLTDQLIDTAHDVAIDYAVYYETVPELAWLEAGVWLLEQVEKEAQARPEKATLIREALCGCWSEIAGFHEQKIVNDESEGEDRLKKYIPAVERAMSLMDNAEERDLIDYYVARNTLAVGARYVERANQSAVIGRADGKLLNVNDREHKDHAHHAIRILQDGRTRLQRHPNGEDYEELLDGTNAGLAHAYMTLYNLTWAHSKMSQSIKILQDGVQDVPEDPELWDCLGHAWELMCDEVVEETNKGIDRGDSMRRMIGQSRNVGTAIGEKMAIAAAELKMKGYRKKAAECYQKAQELMLKLES